MSDQHHSYTGLLLIGFALLILLGAIFFTISQAKVMDITEYKNGNSKLKSAKNWLIAAYVLGYIAAGVSIVLAILYFGHVTWGIRSEVPHAVLFVLLFILVLLSGIFGFVALNEINNSGADNKNSSTNWIWGAEVAGLIAIILLIISGAWRAQYRSSKGKEEKGAIPMTQTYSSTLPNQYSALPNPDTSAQLKVPVTVSVGSGISPPPYQAPLIANNNNNSWDV